MPDQASCGNSEKKSGPTISCKPSSDKSYIGSITSVEIFWSGFSPPIMFTIDWGDGSSETHMSPFSSGSRKYLHRYTLSGEFEIKVIAREYGGVKETTSTKISIVPPPTATLEINPRSGAAPLTIKLSANVKNGIDPIDWILDLGDGSAPLTGSGRNISASHTYYSPGKYAVTLEAQDKSGKSAQAVAEVVVEAQEKKN